MLARLFDVSEKAVGEVIAKLTSLGLLDGARFRHRAVRDAVAESVTADEETELRYRAARLLYEAGTPAVATARQLLKVGPQRQGWAVRLLTEAAAHALDGDVPFAIECLELARECCTDAAEAGALRARLAGLNSMLDPAHSASRFLALKEEVLAGALGPRHVPPIARALLWNLRFDEAAEVVGHAAAAGAAAEPGLRGVRLTAAVSFPDLLARLGAAVPPDVPDPDDPRLPDAADLPPELRAARGLRAVLARAGDEHTVARMEQILQNESLPRSSFCVVEPAILGLVYSDESASASGWCERFLADAERLGLTAWRAVLGGPAALASLRRGMPLRAAEEARATLALLPERELGPCAGLTLATLAEAYTALGETAKAAECFAGPAPSALFQTRAGLHYLFARGRHLLAAGRPHAALADFTTCGELMERWDMDTPALVPWRTGAAEAWLLLGDADRARGLLKDELSLAEGLSPRAHGIALRRLAAVHDPRERPVLLERSLRSLQAGGDRYEMAGAFGELADAYRALGDGTKARVAGRRARQIADHRRRDAPFPAPRTDLAPWTRDARPRRAERGQDALAKLSRSERPVAVLAAQGLTNREIAGRLFVTMSTVEQHLTRIYRKLGIRSRDQLPVDLPAHPAPAA
ncbi:LuxR C-terminal-related transcriptional regulator [Actinomadura yumaensis]